MWIGVKRVSISVSKKVKVHVWHTPISSHSPPPLLSPFYASPFSLQFFLFFSFFSLPSSFSSSMASLSLRLHSLLSSPLRPRSSFSLSSTGPPFPAIPSSNPLLLSSPRIVPLKASSSSPSSSSFSPSLVAESHGIKVTHSAASSHSPFESPLFSSVSLLNFVISINIILISGCWMRTRSVGSWMVFRVCVTHFCSC